MRSNAAEIQAALENMKYPKRKEEILDYAKSHNLSEDIIADLQELSDRTYDNPLEVRNEFEEGRQSGGVRESVKEDGSHSGDERKSR